MATGDEAQSIESTGEHRGESVPSRSRRGFLKQAAATSILGMSGMAIATEAASATENPESGSASDSPQLNTASPTKSAEPNSAPQLNSNVETTAPEARPDHHHVAVYGRPGGNYRIGTTGYIYKGGTADPEDTAYRYYAEGHVQFLGTDDYYYHGTIRYTDADDGVNIEVKY